MEDFQKNSSGLDELDIAIIQELQEDARASYLAIASKLGVVHSTVSRRLNSLIDRHIIAFSVVINYATLGYGTNVVLAINAALGKVNDVAKRLVDLNEIKLLWTTSGRYDILALAFYKEFEDYLRWLREDISNISEKVTIETMPVIKRISSVGLSIPDTHVSDDGLQSRIKPTELDLSLINEIQKSPRASFKDIAANTGTSLSSVRSAYHKLTSRMVIRVVCFPNPSAFGYTVRGITLIKARPSSLHTVVDKLRHFPSVNNIQITLGSFNCLIWTSFQNSQSMSYFLTEELGNMHGVAYYESLVGLTIEKTPLGFTILNQSK